MRSRFSRKAVDEFELIDRYFARQGRAHGVVVGIGDDGAVLRPTADRELVTVIDTMVGKVHFPEDMDAASIGFRAVAVNLSDIAAMGAIPRWMTLALTLPEADPQWLDGFASGLFAAAAEFDVALVGGDTTRGDTLVVSVQITGEMEPGKALLRAGANPGDSIYVTGTIGDAAGELVLNRRGDSEEMLARKLNRPAARIDVGRQLVGVASAAIDISDGFYGDLQKLLAASGVGADVNVGDLPTSDALRKRFDEDEVLRLALGGGDDYELCFTSRRRLGDTIASTPVSRVGVITEGSDLVLRDGNAIVHYEDTGYTHFG